ncbi:peptidase [Pseudomonas sp. ABC1]|uniref:pesticin C-terminus-like muramidase n=1 Tax=Pseudomonas sp. ABC1 TaxID=2748080 RepID=UPI0015C3C785|nr:pesticin C-terminus-like muramidase [Pseudomonas sp. ABC1]QLF92339.1 peptidase [Pseudomonas sp. ABC1]
MSRYSIDFSFIAKLEGGSATRGYVPDAGSSRSGVTIGTGFDLGQRKLADLQAMSLPDALCERLSPYLGMIGQTAVAQLAKLPLIVSAAEAEQIDEAFKEPFINRLAGNYAKSGGGDFSRLPAPMQTVIASVAFQYGDLASRTPNFWQQIVKHDWVAAHANLLSFGDRYTNRRRQEAALLSKAMA